MDLLSLEEFYVMYKNHFATLLLYLVLKLLYLFLYQDLLHIFLPDEPLLELSFETFVSLPHQHMILALVKDVIPHVASALLHLSRYVELLIVEGQLFALGLLHSTWIF